MHMHICTFVMRAEMSPTIFTTKSGAADIVCQMSVPTCIDRFAGTLWHLHAGNTTAPAVSGALGVIAPQDEAYLAAGLSGSLAAMRHPLPAIIGDTRLNGNRNLTRRMDEITRATRWFRLAPPTGAYGYAREGGSAGPGRILLDNATLTDEKILHTQDTWYSKAWGKRVRQGAPARVTRGLAHLPVVAAADPRYPGLRPFVVASRHPNGALALAALGRTLEAHGGWVMPRANVTMFAPGAPVPTPTVPGDAGVQVVGVFGAVAALTVVWEQAPTSVGSNTSVRVWIQDLAGQSAVDVTGRVAWCGPGGAALYVPGPLIDDVASLAQTTGDLSDPGFIIGVSTDHAGETARVPCMLSPPPCPTIPSPPPTPPAPPTPAPGPSPGPSPPIAPEELNGTYIQQSRTKPSIDVLVVNHGADVNIIGHAAGRWDHGTGVILANNIIDAHCFGASNFSTHQVGTASRNQDGRVVLNWRDGDASHGSDHRIHAPLHWAPWIKK